MRVARLLLMVGVMALFGACGGEGDDDASTAAPKETPTPAESNEYPDSVTVLTSGEGFSPPTVDVAIGGTIEFTNEDDERHSITTKDVAKSIDVALKPMDSTTIELADVEPGYYEFGCRFVPYMHGQLQIGPP